MDEREACVALNMMRGIGPAAVRQIAEAMGSALSVFECSERALRGAAGIGRAVRETLLAQRRSVSWSAEFDRAEHAGCRLIVWGDAEYPERLGAIHDPPLVLYVRGTLEARDRHAVAVVGTRRPTVYGRETADRLAFGLAQAGMAVVSGLALGVDTCAHRAALRAAGRTLAVLGSAQDCLYPPQNEELANEIAAQGAVISEFPMGTQPDKTTFPARNRVISGLSGGVVVVEAGERSGALITAGQALEQGRTVFAVPGRIDAPLSRGANALLRDGAVLVRGTDDVLAEFDMLIPGAAARGARRNVLPELSDEEAAIVKAVEDGDRDVDAVVRESGLGAARVSALLVGLEIKRVLRVLPGRRLERVRNL